MTDMTIIIDQETGGAPGAGVEVTEATVDRMGIGVVVEAEVDTKMGACSK